jgi:hypothetical protein
MCLLGCGGRDSGFDALMTADGAQFVRGALPSPAGGPDVITFGFNSSRVAPGLRGKAATGNVPRTAHALAIALDGDVGYWIFTPGATDPQSLQTLQFSVKVSFSPRLSLGKHVISLEAADGAGNYGEPATAELQTDSLPPGNATLTVTLAWDVQADLDLHLVLPDSTVVWAKNINSTNDGTLGGILDFDSNANCQIDGRRQESVYWTTPPPAGHYIARVDAYSLCGEAQANWTLTVGGAAMGKASGWMRDRDTAYPHDANAGVTAIEFDVP